MSVVIALKEKSIVYLACDSLACNQFGQAFYNFPKIWRSINNNILIGGVGNIHVIESVRLAFPYDFDTPTRQTVTAWILDIISKNEISKKDNYSFIIAGDGKAFIARNDALVIEVDRFEAIGSAREIALGALSISENMNFQPEERLHRVVQTCMMYDIGVGGKIEIELI